MYHWQRIDIGLVKSRLALIPEHLRPQPNSGSTWVDLGYIFVLVACQLSILPSVFSGLIGFDLLSAWLALSFIRQNFARSATLAILTSLALETHTVLPAGLYFCAYGCALVAITNVKDILSWNVRTPWLVTTAAVVAWVWIFEFGASLFVHSQVQVDLYGGLYFFSKLLIGLSFAVLLAHREFLRSQA